MRKTTLILILFASVAAVGQTSPTQTNHDPYPNNISYTSTAQQQTLQQIPYTSQSYQQGYQVGQTIGNAIANRRANHWIKKYCKSHPSEAWWYSSPTTGYMDGTCPE
jgi:hypothetical protein